MLKALFNALFCVAVIETGIQHSNVLAFVTRRLIG